MSHLNAFQLTLDVPGSKKDFVTQPNISHCINLPLSFVHWRRTSLNTSLHTIHAWCVILAALGSAVVHLSLQHKTWKCASPFFDFLNFTCIFRSWVRSRLSTRVVISCSTRWRCALIIFSLEFWIFSTKLEINSWLLFMVRIDVLERFKYLNVWKPLKLKWMSTKWHRFVQKSLKI